MLPTAVLTGHHWGQGFWPTCHLTVRSVVQESCQRLTHQTGTASCQDPSLRPSVLPRPGARVLPPSRMEEVMQDGDGASRRGPHVGSLPRQSWVRHVPTRPGAWTVMVAGGGPARTCTVHPTQQRLAVTRGTCPVGRVISEPVTAHDPGAVMAMSCVWLTVDVPHRSSRWPAPKEGLWGPWDCPRSAQPLYSGGCPATSGQCGQGDGTPWLLHLRFQARFCWEGPPSAGERPRPPCKPRAALQVSKAPAEWLENTRIRNGEQGKLPMSVVCPQVCAQPCGGSPRGPPGTGRRPAPRAGPHTHSATPRPLRWAELRRRAH